MLPNVCQFRHRTGRPKRPQRKRKYAAQSLQSTFRGQNIDRTTMNHVSAANFFRRTLLMSF